MMVYADTSLDASKEGSIRKHVQFDTLEDKGVSPAMLDISFPSDVDPSVMDKDAKKKIWSLKRLLEDDPKAADLKWSLFVAATNTYRYDTCLKPFPPMYIKNECKDIEALRGAVESIPPLSVLFKELDNEVGVFGKYGEAIDLMHWVLLRLGDPRIRSVQKDRHESVLKKVPLEMPVAAPNLIFQVISAKQSITEEKWRSSAKDRPTFYAYHGSRLENFHSIVHYGLQQNMCKRSQFGKGIYLSSELGVSLPYSPMGYGWGGSLLGSEISCIALCELMDHCDIKRGDSRDNARNALDDSVGGRVPDKYYVVTNSDLVRIRYLLVYTQDFHATSATENAGLLTWFKQHKLLTFVLGYIVLLASVGLTQNKQIEKYYRFFIQKAGLE